MATSGQPSKFMSTEKRQIRKKLVEEILSEVEKMKLLRRVKADVSAGLHLTHFQEWQAFWESRATSELFQASVHALLLEYVSLVRRSSIKGKLKYAKLLVEVMELQRVLLHKLLHVEQSSKHLRVRSLGEMCFQSNESYTAWGHCQAPHFCTI